MYDVVALGELLIDFAPQSVNEGAYPHFPLIRVALFPGSAESVRLQPP